MNIIGKCSICGGQVTVPLHWSGIVPPVPTCSSCGALKADETPVVKMVPVRTISTTSIDDVLTARERKEEG